MTDNQINIDGYSLVSKLSLKEVEIVKDASTKLDKIKGVSEILDLSDRILNYVEDTCDAYGSTISKFIHLGDKKLGLEIEDYKSLQKIATNLLDIEFIYRRADLKFLENKCFDWLIDIYKNNQAKMDLIVFIYESIEADLKDYEFNFKINAIGIEESFNIGFVEIYHLDEDKLENEYLQLSSRFSTSRDEFNDIFKRFKDRIIAKIKVNAIKSRAQEIAKSEVKLAINALRCFLIYESLDFTTQILYLDFNSAGYNNSDFLVKDCNENSVEFNFNQNHGAAPTIINQTNYNSYQKLGLKKINEFLIGERSTELSILVENSINQFGEVISTRDLHNRVVRLISFFESIIVPKTNTKAKGQMYLKNKVLVKIPYSSSERTRQIINNFYDIRDKFLHNRIVKPIDLAELFEFQKLGLVLLLNIVELNKKMSSIAEVLDYFEIK
ncbi:hypothetical protein [uncultured Draconibacterium sp.]|uniref:hypothetical protein n=1 Tax=uncultured Draconibacterium sp. TaxID=1573823 RepID=UPI0029C07667|nr:hypothetical protein [uncultured Draconibacterium sp.]